MYEDLLSATKEAEMEWIESKISVRVRSASVEEQREEGVTELQSRIGSLTAILRSSTLAIGKPEGNRKRNREKQCRKVCRGRVNQPQLLQGKEKDQGFQQGVHQKVIENLSNLQLQRMGTWMERMFSKGKPQFGGS